VLGLLGVWSGLILGVQKHMMAAGFKELKNQISDLSSVKESFTALERELLELKADLPLSYVRREDFIRFDVVINSKLDKLRDLVVEALQGKAKKES